MSSIIKTGQISLIIGPMFAGKSSELLRLLNIYSRCYKTIFITHTIDTREYLSHNSMMEKNLKNTQISYMQCSHIKYENLKDFDVIGIDEGQFFENLKESVIELAKNNKIIIVTGLDADYNQNVFTEIVNLIPYAYEIKKLTALCNKCIAENKNRIKNNAKNNETENIESGNIINMAPVTVRLSDNKERLVVGQEEVYSVSCLKHLFKE